MDRAACDEIKLVIESVKAPVNMQQDRRARTDARRSGWSIVVGRWLAMQQRRESAAELDIGVGEGVARLKRVENDSAAIHGRDTRH